jgi:hypothetical protein
MLRRADVDFQAGTVAVRSSRVELLESSAFDAEPKGPEVD